MKLVINGRSYDTDTATLIGEHVSGEPMGPGYTRETLYRKREGEYFVVVRDTYTVRVVPLKYKEAEAWAILNYRTVSFFFSSRRRHTRSRRTP